MCLVPFKTMITFKPYNDGPKTSASPNQAHGLSLEGRSHLPTDSSLEEATLDPLATI